MIRTRRSSSVYPNDTCLRTTLSWVGRNRGRSGSLASSSSPACSHSSYGCSPISWPLISSSVIRRPSAVSIRNILPGSRRPLATMSSVGMSSTPASEASTTRPSRVCHQRPGRSPLRSSTAPTIVPSVKVTQAGPSHASIIEAWNWQNARRRGSMSGTFSQASGTIIITQCGTLRPPRCSSSNTSSSDAESEASGVQIGNSRLRSPGIRSVSRSASRARMRFRLPRTVLISPLWATNRNGCARGQDGKVLVENRECTIAMALSARSSRRSG